MFYFDISVNYAQISTRYFSPTPAVEVPDRAGAGHFQVCVSTAYDIAPFFGSVFFGPDIDLIGTAEKRLAAPFGVSGPIDVYFLEPPIQAVGETGKDGMIGDEIVKSVAVKG